MKVLKKLTAFTLAETLIVMGIIGVVAALTIPSLTNSTNSKDVVAKVRKANSALEDAWGRMIAQNGEIDDWGTFSAASLASRLTAPMKLTKNCGASANCSASFSLKSDGTVTSAPSASFIMADGTKVGILLENTACSSNVATTNAPLALKSVCGSINIDIDGDGGKNTVGIDRFNFWMTKDGIIPAGTEGDNKATWANCKAGGGAGCTAWVVINGNLDYRNASDSHVCKTSNITLAWSAGNTHCD